MKGLRPSRQLDFSTKGLAQAWKTWMYEFSLYAELIVVDKEDKIVVKLFYNLTGGKGQEVNTTLIAGTPQTLKQQMEAFDAYCDSRKHETVARYQFFSCNQMETEGIDAYDTKINTLASTWNFGDLKVSLTRDRIVIGTQDPVFLTERLLREEDLTLGKRNQIA